MENLQKQKELNQKLKVAAKAYYIDGKEIMSNFEYDKLYDQLLALEKETGIIFSDSVTQNVGFEVLTDLKKEKHPSKMLSLDKTKDRDVLKKWLGNQDGVLSFKLDGLTIVAHYNDGKLQKAVTRGNGIVGEIITHNARFFKGLPAQIPFKENLIIRGEALMKYSEFERINELIPDETEKYKNPRNLASGTIRQLDSAMMKEREINFYAFTLVDGLDSNSYEERLNWLETQGFQVVKHKKVTINTLDKEMDKFGEEVKINDFPSDGLVLFYNDIKYGNSLGSTSKFPRNGMAFKWKDETAKTVLRKIEWSASRTGLLNPVAIFDPVELEGTTVSRASVHNLSIIDSLKLNIGDTIDVFKANMIIPQIAENQTRSLKNIKNILPTCCPVCGREVNIEKNEDTVVLRCINKDCAAKHIGKFEHFVSRDAVNIIGLSSAKLEQLIDFGIIKEFKDLYSIEKNKDKIVNMEGFGEKSYENLKKSIEKSREIEPDHFLYALGIEEIGKSTSRDIMKYFHYDFEKIFEKNYDDFIKIDGIGEKMANNLVHYFDKNAEMVKELMKEFTFIVPEINENETALTNKTFVITGKLHIYANRDALKKEIENNGGKVVGSVSSKTDYLINNDSTSNSSKNKKAKELGIQIITEDEFEEMF